MPYIKELARKETEAMGPYEEGDLAYLIYLLCLNWISNAKPFCEVQLDNNKDKLQKAWNYSTMSQVIGILETVKLEFARQHLYPYEDMKRIENGDVTKFITKFFKGYEQYREKIKEDIR